MVDRADAALPYGRQWIDEEDVAAVTAALRGDWLTTGPAVEAFERALASRENVAAAVALSSGTAALHLAYRAAGVGPGTEVVTSPLTFAATANAALLLGATLRFADIDPETGTLDPAAADAETTSATRVWAPVDYAGHPADYEALCPLAERRSVSIIADACHSLGARFRGRSTAQWADAAALSFHPVKAIATGEGGAVLSDREDWCARVARLRNHGIARDPSQQEEHGPWHYEIRELGYNYRIPDLLCALGSSQLRKLPRFLERRRSIAARYRRAFAGEDRLELPAVSADVDHAWHLFVLRVREKKRRRALFEGLVGRGIGVQLHYRPLTRQPLYRGLGIAADACPIADDFSDRALSIPLFPAMSDAAVERVIEEVNRAARELL